MVHPILGLHHVTATVDDSQRDLDFCIELLGLRLVKKTVNFDNHHVYHFYYGNERGTPGTLWTTFPYRDHGVPVGVKGAGQVVATSFSVPEHSLEYWRERLKARGAEVRDVTARFGEPALTTVDPSGLWIELVATKHDNRVPWIGHGVGESEAIRGLHSATMVVRNVGPTVELMKSLLNYEVVDKDGARTRVAAGSGAPGHFIDIVEDQDVDPAKNGLGTVHHIAMAIANGDEQLQLRQELLQMGLRVTEVRDRCYFQSIYFREPGGVLFEVATLDPGFAVDEPLASLGRDLKLPPWEEQYRAEIEPGLAHVEYR
jgi:glyoxalase family protein